MQLRPDARIPQGGGKGDGGGEVLGHGQDQRVRRGGEQVVVQVALILQNEEQTGQTDGNAYSGQLFIGVVFR